MHSHRARVFCLAVLVTCAPGCQEPQATDDPEPQTLSEAPDRLPPNLDLADVGRGAFWNEERQFGVQIRPVVIRVLAWIAEEDDRPLYVESCVVWARWEHVDGTRWRLAHLYRHPALGELSWYPPVRDHFPDVSVRDFDRPPTNPDVYRFLADNRWDFRPSPPGFVIRDAGVCARAWREVIGQEPERFFDPKEIKPRPVDSWIGPAPRDITGQRRPDADASKNAELPPASPPVGPAPRVVEGKREH